MTSFKFHQNHTHFYQYCTFLIVLLYLSLVQNISLPNINQKTIRQVNQISNSLSMFPSRQQKTFQQKVPSKDIKNETNSMKQKQQSKGIDQGQESRGSPSLNSLNQQQTTPATHGHQFNINPLINTSHNNSQPPESQPKPKVKFTTSEFLPEIPQKQKKPHPQPTIIKRMGNFICGCFTASYKSKNIKQDEQHPNNGTNDRLEQLPYELETKSAKKHRGNSEDKQRQRQMRKDLKREEQNPQNGENRFDVQNHLKEQICCQSQQNAKPQQPVKIVQNPLIHVWRALWNRPIDPTHSPSPITLPAKEPPRYYHSNSTNPYGQPNKHISYTDPERQERNKTNQTNTGDKSIKTTQTAQTFALNPNDSQRYNMMKSQRQIQFSSDPHVNNAIHQRSSNWSNQRRDFLKNQTKLKYTQSAYVLDEMGNNADSVVEEKNLDESKNTANIYLERQSGCLNFDCLKMPICAPDSNKFDTPTIIQHGRGQESSKTSRNQTQKLETSQKNKGWPNKEKPISKTDEARKVQRGQTSRNIADGPKSDQVKCNCKKSHCVKDSCGCYIKGWKCTKLCECSQCDNCDSGNDRKRRRDPDLSIVRELSEMIDGELNEMDQEFVVGDLVHPIESQKVKVQAQENQQQKKGENRDSTQIDTVRNSERIIESEIQKNKAPQQAEIKKSKQNSPEQIQREKDRTFIQRLCDLVNQDLPPLFGGQQIQEQQHEPEVNRPCNKTDSRFVSKGESNGGKSNKETQKTKMTKAQTDADQQQEADRKINWTIKRAPRTSLANKMVITK